MKERPTLKRDHVQGGLRGQAGTSRELAWVDSAEEAEGGQDHSLTQGATGERLCWKPGAQRLQVRPVTPSLQGHWPVVWLQVLPAAPTG